VSAAALIFLLCVLLAGGVPGEASAQPKPEGEMRRALYVTLSPVVSDPRKREAMLHQIQQLVHERVRFGPIWEYIWPSGVGPRVDEPALMLINPYPWSAPLEEIRLKKR
jgi:hypothetical protein